MDLNVSYLGPDELAAARQWIAAWDGPDRRLQELALGTLSTEAVIGRSTDEAISFLAGVTGTLAFMVAALLAAVARAQEREDPPADSVWVILDRMIDAIGNADGPGSS